MIRNCFFFGVNLAPSSGIDRSKFKSLTDTTKPHVVCLCVCFSILISEICKICSNFRKCVLCVRAPDSLFKLHRAIYIIIKRKCERKKNDVKFNIMIVINNCNSQMNANRKNSSSNNNHNHNNEFSNPFDCNVYDVCCVFILVLFKVSFGLWMNANVWKKLTRAQTHTHAHAHMAKRKLSKYQLHYYVVNHRVRESPTIIRTSAPKATQENGFQRLYDDGRLHAIIHLSNTNSVPFTTFTATIVCCWWWWWWSWFFICSL